MSTSLKTTSCPSFQSVFDAALEGYTKQTGIELAKHPTAYKIQNCHSPEDVIQLLLERESAFKDYRDKYRKLIDCIRPVVQVVHAFSGVLGETSGIVLVSLGDWISVGSYLYTPLQGPFQPAKAICVCVDVLLTVRTALLLSITDSSRALCEIYPRQAAIGVTANYGAILDLLECVANFLGRLHIYTEKIPLSSSMSDIMVKIMIEVLSVFSLVTTQIKRGRFSTRPLPAYIPC